MGSDWTEVRRRRKGTNVGFHPNATSYFVAGLSDRCRKTDMRECFRRFGDIADIYMGTRKNSSGRNFAFVKFSNVIDIWSLEREMQGVVCCGRHLSVNVARYERDKNLIVTVPPQKNSGTSKTPIATNPCRIPVSHVIPPHAKSFGRKSFAAVAKGSGGETIQLPTPIMLDNCCSTRNWLCDTVLVGEVLSLDHMASLSSVLNIGDGSLECIKYIGGLNVALCFKDQAMARDFLDDSDRWIEWFQRIVLGGSGDFCDDRIAWLNIVGLPMRLWSDGNISSVIHPYGKIVVPPEDIELHSNNSWIRIGILTKYRRWINDDVAVSVGGMHFNVGLVEFDRNWSPFSSAFSEQTSDGDSSRDGRFGG
ncbi:hypothetical protein L1887_33238 [Cichorium endivia]|nr:hypothetical protein L1887_33238 [Cichorium endivia]